MVVLMAGCFRWVKRRNQPTRDVKLVIIGLDDAGKTTTIACLEGEPPDGITPTVGFSNAKITMGKWNITIYDLGGGISVRSVWQKYYAEVYGMIFAVDSGDHNRLVESKNVLNEIFHDPKVNGKPVVVFANKQDKDGALNEEEVSKKLALQELSKKYNFKFNVFSCSAIQGYGKTMDKRIKTGLEWLLNAIHQDYSIINEKVTKESAIQREQELKEKKERMERIKKLREEREKAAKEAGIVEEESDEDVVSNPFRNIKEQVEVTQKREKKAKEKMKKIKAYQDKKKNGVQSVGETGKPKKRMKEGDYIDSDDNDNAVDDDDNDDQISGGDNPQKKKKSIKKRKSVENFCDNDDISPKKKNKKKKIQKFKRKSDDENLEDREISTKKKKNKSEQVENRFENESIDVSDSDETCKPKGKKRDAKNSNETKDIESELSSEYNRLNLNNKIINDLKHNNGPVDLTQHNIIQVSSKENVRENTPPKMNKKKKKINNNNNELDIESAGSDNNIDCIVDKNIKKKKKILVCDVNNYYVNESETDINKLREKEINDSRAELFLARSNESLDKVEHEANCCNNKLKKGKKKKNQTTEFHNVQDTKTDAKKKKKKKANKTEPQLACSSYLEGTVSNGNLPPLRGGSKLEPIKLTRRLPKWSGAEDSSIPSWALAKPNFDDDEVIT